MNDKAAQSRWDGGIWEMWIKRRDVLERLKDEVGEEVEDCSW